MNRKWFIALLFVTGPALQAGFFDNFWPAEVNEEPALPVEELTDPEEIPNMLDEEPVDPEPEIDLEPAPAPEPMANVGILELLDITASDESVDYVNNQTEFQLHTLITEQRHPKTMQLSQLIQEDSEAALKALLSVDEDITAKIEDLAQNPEQLEGMAHQIAEAIREGSRVYVYGCGATGRLAKQLESSFWRPFWSKLEQDSAWRKIRNHFPDIKNRLVGEMTGGDRALISSLEGFEDLQLIGKLQAQEHGITDGDVVITVTEGGETSSVIGTVLSLVGDSGRPYFVYNNPDEVLMPFERSRAVLEHPGIEKVCLFTGPQAIAGSTRMQATTTETFVLGVVLEEAIYQLLDPYLSKGQLKQFGLVKRSLSDRLRDFDSLQKSVASAAPQIAKLTELEAKAYLEGHFSTYFANEALITLFTDSTERSPTFRLAPLDRVDSEERRCLIQVCTLAKDQQAAWLKFLGRPFKGLNPALYQDPFSNEIENPYLRDVAIRSLEKAGDDQQQLYDFSHQNILKSPGDISVAALFEGELGDKQTQKFLKSMRNTHLIAVTTSSKALPRGTSVIPLKLKPIADPLLLRSNIALKMALNAHSTAVMAKLGKVVGNTMTYVQPSNLKLIGRATNLIFSHVNDHLANQITYAEANAVLFDAKEYRAQNNQPVSEVALSIIRILEGKKRGVNVSWQEVEEILAVRGLEGYLNG